MASVDDRVGSIDRRDRDGARARADRRRLFSQSVFASDAVGRSLLRHDYPGKHGFKRIGLARRWA